MVNTECVGRTSCVIAVTKARDIFEPFLYQVKFFSLVSYVSIDYHTGGPFLFMCAFTDIFH